MRIIENGYKPHMFLLKDDDWSVKIGIDKHWLQMIQATVV